MPEDVEEEIGQEGEAIGFDIRTLTFAALFVVLALIVYGFYYEHTAMGMNGVNLVQSIVNLPEAWLNGLTGAVNAFFRWLDGGFKLAVYSAAALFA